MSEGLQGLLMSLNGGLDGLGKEALTGNRLLKRRGYRKLEEGSNGKQLNRMPNFQGKERKLVCLQGCTAKFIVITWIQSFFSSSVLHKGTYRELSYHVIGLNF